jgi:long-chain acyl-CoA synthetase
MSSMTTPLYLIRNAQEYANEAAFSSKNASGGWDTTTWSEFYEYVMDISKSLIDVGFEVGDKLSIYSYNRKEWYGAYAASQMLGGVGVGVYHTCSPEEVEWVVGNSESKVVFVGNNPMDGGDTSKMPCHRLAAILDKLEDVQSVVIMDGCDVPDHSKITTWSEFYTRGNGLADSVVLERANSITPDDTSALIYTSGTTGNPKGVELTHDNWIYEIDELEKCFRFGQGDRYVSWLPLAHVFGQALDNHYWIRYALHLYSCDNPLMVVDYAKEVQPHLFIGVPRIYEKIYSTLSAVIASKAILKIGLKIPGLKSVFQKKLKAAVGFADLKVAISGAAPINPDILTLFTSLTIPIFEGYGMTENTAGATLNYPGHNKIGSVGKALGGTEMMIADDGEIMMRGRHVMKGYYKNPESTAETIDSENWLHTGDIGKIDSDGYVYITGRMKEIYVSSGGKNIPPLVIEETFKAIPIVSQCFLVGDGRKYCSALFTLDMGAILRDKIGIPIAEIPKSPYDQYALIQSSGHTLEEYTAGEEVRAEIQSYVDTMNLKFSNPEQLKKFAILPRDFTVDDGELTPTLKIRRIQIRENWSDVIEAMYADS